MAGLCGWKYLERLGHLLPGFVSARRPVLATGSVAAIAHARSGAERSAKQSSIATPLLDLCTHMVLAWRTCVLRLDRCFLFDGVETCVKENRK